nr:unnamed protein product [Callosobruchus chinensis]
MASQESSMSEQEAEPSGGLRQKCVSCHHLSKSFFMNQDHVMELKVSPFKRSEIWSRTLMSLQNRRPLYKAQIRPTVEYVPHIWGAAASTTLSIIGAVQRRAI